MFARCNLELEQLPIETAAAMAPLNHRRVVLFPLSFHGHLNPMLRLAAALHGRGLAVTMLHADHCAPDPAAHPAAFRFVPIRRSRTASASCSPTVMAYSACSAASFRTFVAYPTLLDKGYLPVQESRKEDLVHELPPLRVKDLQRVDSSSLAGFAGMVARVVAEARQSSGLILNTFDAIEAGDVNNIRDNLSIPVFAAPRSVLFVSLSTMAVIDTREFVELARGLVGSNRPFLLFVRSILVHDTSGELLHPPVDVVEEEEMRGDRGRVVPCAPW
ncbi:hypothetical protein PR202_gb05666 [Eleusine coracana subsp. coracana]|uniref:Uncharacterized protein n=1 Tax=Eleusine coracana subsp. coracana TaxID=191504 RepID=A0AAV5E7M1_ELECO|nr:hypothetical protein PR202_gb05666 [Eleusine coracana subsp. coracana]